jgi:hypothetical protein
LASGCRPSPAPENVGTAGRAAILEYIGDDRIEVGTAEVCPDS